MMYVEAGFLIKQASDRLDRAFLWLFCVVCCVICGFCCWFWLISIV